MEKEAKTAVKRTRKKAEVKEAAEEMTVNCDGYSGLNVRERPEAASKVVKTLPHGFKVMAGPVENGWRSVEGGYVMDEFVE